MRTGKSDFGIPEKTLDVSRARYQLTRLLRRLREYPEVYLITQSGKPAGALVNLKWLQALVGQLRGQKRFTVFGQAEATPDWEKALGELRASLRAETLERHASPR